MHRFLRDSSAVLRRARRRIREFAVGARRNPQEIERLPEGALALGNSLDLQASLELQEVFVSHGPMPSEGPYTSGAVARSNGAQRVAHGSLNRDRADFKFGNSELGNRDFKETADVRDPIQERDWESVNLLGHASVPGLNVGQFVHDLDNLLMVIANRAELAQGDVESDQRCADSIRAIQAATRRALGLSELLRNTLAHSRVPKCPVDLAQVVQATVDGVRAWMPTDVAIVLDLPPEAPNLVFGNFTQLQRVVQNLVSNAIDSLRSGGHVFVSLELTDKCTARPHSNRWYAEGAHARHPSGRRQHTHRQRLATDSPRHVILRVCDNGIGMDASTLARVFEPGFSQKRHGPGTGLGMSIVADIVRDHGGEMTIDTAEGEGTDVCIGFPAARVVESNDRHE